ncbi:hypothetical protein H8356DRAFT_1303849 [Neocallimastix lanati (nom. inval.)]|nr:hypothetical protein H8356DRAFT_1303849 [Neocallimastix sp. JGI-2020a]
MKNRGAYNHDFACHQGYVKQRGNVTDKLIIKNPLNNSVFRLDDARVTLVQPESNGESIPYQQWFHYSFWTHIIWTNLSINNSIPGTYQLCVWTKGIIGKHSKYQSIPWNIYFNLRKKPTSTSVLRFLVAGNSSIALLVSINGRKNSAELANFKDDTSVRRNSIRGFYGELEFKFGPNNFKIGENKITLHVSNTGGHTNNYQFDGIMYDQIRLETPGLLII